MTLAMFSKIMIHNLQGLVIEKLSKHCGGFIKSLSLRGCQHVSDAALRLILACSVYKVFVQSSVCKTAT